MDEDAAGADGLGVGDRRFRTPPSTMSLGHEAGRIVSDPGWNWTCPIGLGPMTGRWAGCCVADPVSWTSYREEVWGEGDVVGVSETGSLAASVAGW